MQQGGSPYGAPPHPDNRNLFPTPPPSAQHQMAGGAGAAESAVPQPISTRPPPPPSSSAAPSYEEFGAAAEDPLGDEGGAGGGGMSGGSGGGGGNRWPRQETLALLKIRSDMDATFRDATLKGPLWEEVSRKLAELGYRRSAKKCKEKFENVHKYYKRTKEGRAGRQDGKSYRFFSQLEALHSTTAAAASSAAASGPSVFTPAATTTAAMGTPISAVTNQPPAVAARFQAPPPQQQQQQISAPTPIATAPPTQHLHPMSMLGHEHQNAGAAAAAAGMSFTSNTSSDASDSEGDEDDEATEEGPSSGKKRKREGGAGGRKMMAFFEGLMRQVMERQEAMQQRFLDAIEKREQDRMIRDEAWRRQEIARLAREQELAAGERAAAAARDAAVISFLQKFTGQTVPIPPHAAATTAPSPAPAPAPAPSPATISIVQTPPPLQIQTQQLTSPPSQPQQQQQPPTPPPQQQSTEIARQQYHQQQQQTPPPMRPTSSEIVPFSSDPHEGGASMSVSLDPASSRWPKLEVHALIKLRSGLDSRYQESGPKGPLWEEISAGMQRLGYKRSAKRCKEKWENINKYFKKVKESNKKRPEDAKTCPYFHQLDALYRNKLVSGGVSGGMPASSSRPHEHESHLNPSPNPISVMPPPVQQQQQPPPPTTTNQGEMDIKKGNGDHGSGGPNNGGLPTAFYGDDSTSGMQKKPEDIVKELMGQSSNDYSRLDEPDSDNMDEDEEEEEDDEDDEDGEGQYTIQFQRQNVGGGGANANANGSSGGGGASTAPPSSGGKAAGSFLAMVR